MEQQDQADRFLLELPPRARYVATARMFAAALARHYGVGEDSVEDLKVAVSEACTSAIRARRQGLTEGPMRLAAVADGEHITFSARDAGIVQEHAPPGAGGSPTWERVAGQLGVETIRALFPDAEVASGDGPTADLRFRVERGGHPAG